VGKLLPALPRTVRCSHSGATLCQEFHPYLACSPVTEVPALLSSSYAWPIVRGGRRRISASLKRRVELPMYSKSAGRLRRAVSWPDCETGKAVETMDKVRALIIDDSSVMRKIVERSLRQAGIELEKVVEAANGAEGLAALRDNVVDLILCDINMPVMDGLEFVRQVATVENAKGVPIVMITTEGSESHVVAALSAGARGYIRKPFTPDQVKEHVLSLLERKP
jgi:two-component system, chemotaxis family, chemotaxis protein CheY